LPFDPASLLLLSSSSSAQISSSNNTPPQQTKQPQKIHKQQNQSSVSIASKKETEQVNKSKLLAQQAINTTTNNTNNTANSLKNTLENIELKMRIIASPNIRIADLFKCFLKNVPKSTETIEVNLIFHLI
jgi:hypothetical protein